MNDPVDEGGGRRRGLSIKLPRYPGKGQVWTLGFGVRGSRGREVEDERREKGALIDTGLGLSHVM